MTIETGETRRARPWLALLPLAVFAGLAAIFLMQLLSGRNSSVVPSVLIGHPAPLTDLPPIEGTGLPGLSSADFKGRVTVLNVWASWCAPCREEQPLLLALADDERFRLVGLDYKDKPENARRFLGELGDPFDAIGSDQTGQTAINWGVYGVPETFLIGKDGTILYKHVGPFDARSIAGELMPAIEKAVAASRKNQP